MEQQGGSSEVHEQSVEQTEFPQVFGVPAEVSADAENTGLLYMYPDEPLPGRAPEPAPAPPADPPKAKEAGSSRLLSLDAFRGLTILGMVLVNNMVLDTATPRQFVHAPWNGGVRIADMVFPWFLLAAGVSIPFAAASHRRKGLSAWQYAWKALKRAVTLLFLGCLLDSSIAHQPVFGLGVLQIIGIAYLVAALLYGLPAAARAAVAGLFLVGYWALIRYVPIPGKPAGLFLNGENIVHYINMTYLQRLHLNGLLSAIPTSAMVLIGTGLGDLFRARRPAADVKAVLLAAIGLALVVAGWFWNLDLPFNKPVWTPSYILYTAGLGALVLSLFYLVTDVLRWQRWAFPLVVFGTNAVLAYMLPIMVKVYVLHRWTWPMPGGSAVSLQQAILGSLVAHAGPLAGGWLYTLGYIGVWWVVLLYFYRKGIFIRA